jgi:xylulokinase
MTAICLDAGTTMIKAIGYADDGAELVTVREPTAVRSPAPGHSEQDMSEVWAAVVRGVRAVAERLGGDISYVALTAQGDGCWLVDERGEPTGPAILWNDGRAAPIVDGWTRAGAPERSFAVNGSLPFPGLPNAILTWLRAHDPARIERSHRALTCGGWVFSRLTGELTMDESDACVPFMDVRTRRYSDELFALYDMEWARRLLPEPRGDDRRAAPLGERAAAELGLPAGTPVVLSSYDIASTSIGVGAVDDGQACVILGTTLCTEIVVPETGLGGAPSGFTIPLGLPGRYLRAFPTLAGTGVLDWACGMLGVAGGPRELAELADGAAPGAGGLVFLPYLSPAGERAPFVDSRARGAFLGLSSEHGRADLARAVLEGLSLVVRDCLAASGAAPTELRVAGGGSASPVWLRMLADVTGVPVVRSRDDEAGARGAYALGRLATGGDPGAYAGVRDTFAPDPARAAAYTALYDDFRALRETETRTWPRLAALRARDTGDR